MPAIASPAESAKIDLDALEAHVHAELHGRVRDLRVVSDEGGLRLRGCTHTYYVKQLAQHAVMRATSMRIVANEIEVM
jgi:hypothetical protein